MGKRYNGSIDLMIKDKNEREIRVEFLQNVTIDTFKGYTKQLDLDVDSRDIRNVSLVWNCIDKDEKSAKINVWLVTLDPIYRDVPTRGAYFKFFCHRSWLSIKPNVVTNFFPCWINDVNKEIDYEREHNPE